MKRAFAALLTLALVLFLVPAAGAISDSAPHASTWEQTDIMGAFVPLIEPDDQRATCVQDSWLLSHDKFFRGGVGDEVPDDPFDNAGQFTAIETEKDGTETTHSGEIWWIASGMAKLVGLLPDASCETAEVPVDGEFRGVGAMRIDTSTGGVDRVDREGTTCSLKFTSHLTGDPGDVTADPPVLPEVTWTGNFVAHCDDGAKIHLDILGSVPGGLEFMGIAQESVGVILDK